MLWCFYSQKKKEIFSLSPAGGPTPSPPPQLIVRNRSCVQSCWMTNEEITVTIAGFLSQDFPLELG